MPMIGIGSVSPVWAAEEPIRDGKLYDVGTQMTTAAESAPEDLSRMAPFVGLWDLKMGLFTNLCGTVFQNPVVFAHARHQTL